MPNFQLPRPLRAPDALPEARKNGLRAAVRTVSLLLAACLAVAGQTPDPLDRARALMLEGKTGEAIPTLRRYLSRAPSSADGHTLLGIALLQEGQVREAGKALEKAFALEPKRPDVREALARVRILEGEPAKAVPLLRPLATSPGADEVVRILYARSLLTSGDASAAAAVLDPLAERSPGPKVSLLAAQAHAAVKDYARTAEICERAMLTAVDADAVEKLYLSLPSEVLAARLAARFQRLQSVQDSAEEIALGRVLSDMDPGRTSSAPKMGAELLERTTKREPGNALAWFHYGRALRHLADPQASLDAWNKALSLNPDDDLRVRILTHIARRRKSLGDAAKAEEAYRAALSFNRGMRLPNAEAAFEYYEFLKAQSRPEEARQLLAELLGWNTLFPPARLELAREFAQNAQWRQAIGEAELVLRTAEGDMGLLRSAHVVLARAYAAAGDAARSAPHQEWVEQHPK